MRPFRAVAACAALAIVLVVAALTRPAEATDAELRCQRIIEDGGVRLASRVLRATRRCDASGAPSLAACLDAAPVRAGLDRIAARWSSDVARACAAVDVHGALGYHQSCAPADTACGFASADVVAAGPRNDLVDCLACKVETRIRAAADRLFAGEAASSACHAAIARPGLTQLATELRAIRACLRGPAAISIAACLSDPELRSRLAGATARWRDAVTSACTGSDPFQAPGYGRLCAGTAIAAPPNCSDASPPCSFNVATVTGTPGQDDDLVDCTECQASEAALGTARDLFGAELCCDGAGCRTVRSRRSCRASGGFPTYYRQEVLPGLAAGFPHGIAVASDGTVWLPDRVNGGVHEAPPGAPIVDFRFYSDVFGYTALSPDGITLDAADQPVITSRESNYVVRLRGVLDPVRTIALDGTPAHRGDGGPARHASAAAPSGLGFDSRGTLYLTESGLLGFAFQNADPGGEFVRAIDAAGIIHTVAGTPDYGTAGAGGAARSAQLGIPYSLAVRSDGSILVGEAGAERLLELDPGGRLLHRAGRASSPVGAYSGDGGPALDARFYGLEGLAVDQDGNALIGDFRNGRVRLLDRLGSVISISGRDDGFGRLLPIATGVPATQVWGGCPGGVAVGPDGRVYVGDGQLQVVRILVPTRY